MRRIFISLAVIFLILVTVVIYTYQYHFFTIFDEPLPAIQHEPLKQDDPYLEDRQQFYKRLERLEIFWQKRLEITENKDYYLVISLLDSLIWLDINGVTIHQGKILSYSLCANLQAKRMRRDISEWIQTDFYLQEEWATIPKYPIRTKDISGNNINLDSLDFRPSEIDSTDIYVVFIYNESLKLAFVQPHPASKKQPWLKKQIPLTDGLLQTEITGNDTLRYGDLLDGDWISVTIAASDIIAIYRALNIPSLLVIGI